MQTVWSASRKYRILPAVSKSSSLDGFLILWSLVYGITSCVLHHSCWHMLPFLLGNAISRNTRPLPQFISCYRTWVHDSISELHVLSLMWRKVFFTQSAKSIVIYWVLLFYCAMLNLFFWFFFFPNLLDRSSIYSECSVSSNLVFLYWHCMANSNRWRGWKSTHVLFGRRQQYFLLRILQHVAWVCTHRSSHCSWSCDFMPLKLCQWQ